MQVNLDESLAADDELVDLEWEGHVVGDVWQVGPMPTDIVS